MVKKLALYTSRLLFLNVVSIIISVLLLFVFDNDVFRWVMCAFLTFLLWLFVWIDSSNIGQKDVQKDKITLRKAEQEEGAVTGAEGLEFKRWFGFAAGLLAQIPALVLIIWAYASGSVLVLGLARGWFITYTQAIVSLEGLLPHLLFVFVALYVLVAGLGYLNGPAQQRRLETIIERNKAKKARRVQDDLKAKKGPQKKQPVRK